VKAEPADAAAAAPTAAQLNVAEPFVKAEPSETPLDALPLAHDPARASAAHAALASGSSLAALLDDPSSPALRQAASRLKAASQRAEALHGLPPLLPAEEVRLRTHILRPALPYDFGAARAHLEEADPRFRILFHQADFRKYLANGNEGPENLNLFKYVWCLTLPPLRLTSACLGRSPPPSWGSRSPGKPRVPSVSSSWRSSTHPHSMRHQQRPHQPTKKIRSPLCPSLRPCKC
jgi:hypothetical protein